MKLRRKNKLLMGEAKFADKEQMSSFVVGKAKKLMRGSGKKAAEEAVRTVWDMLITGYKPPIKREEKEFNVMFDDLVKKTLGESSEIMGEARESKYMKQIMDMTNDERKNLSFKAKAKFHSVQYQPIVDKIADKVAMAVNNEGKKMRLVTWDTATGKLQDHPYKVQGLLEHVIDELKMRV